MLVCKLLPGVVSLRAHVFAFLDCCSYIVLLEEQQSSPITAQGRSNLSCWNKGQVSRAMMNAFFILLLCPGFGAALLEPRLRTGGEKACSSYALTPVLRINSWTCCELGRLISANVEEAGASEEVGVCW